MCSSCKPMIKMTLFIKIENNSKKNRNQYVNYYKNSYEHPTAGENISGQKSSGKAKRRDQRPNLGRCPAANLGKPITTPKQACLPTLNPHLELVCTTSAKYRLSIETSTPPFHPQTF